MSITQKSLTKIMAIALAMGLSIALLEATASHLNSKMSGASLMIVNDSNSDLNNVSVQLWNTEIMVGSLKRNEKKRIKVDNYFDSSWKVTGTWDDGEDLDISYGYVTHGLDFRDTIVINDDRSISFSSKQGVVIFGILY